MEIDQSKKQIFKLGMKFQSNIELGMNLYYDLWTELFKYKNDYEKIMIICHQIKNKNEEIADLYNEIIKNEGNQENINTIYESYLKNYMNDGKNSKIVGDRAHVKNTKKNMKKNKKKLDLKIEKSFFIPFILVTIVLLLAVLFLPYMDFILKKGSFTKIRSDLSNIKLSNNVLNIISEIEYNVYSYELFEKNIFSFKNASNQKTSEIFQKELKELFIKMDSALEPYFSALNENILEKTYLSIKSLEDNQSITKEEIPLNTLKLFIDSVSRLSNDDYAYNNQKYADFFFVKENGLNSLREFSENISNLLLDKHSMAIPEQRNHNKLFLLLQIFLVLPVCGILAFIIIKTSFTNKKIISKLNRITENDVKEVEKKYQKYFILKEKTNIVSEEFSTNTLDLEFSQKFKKSSNEALQPKDSLILKTKGSSSHLVEVNYGSIINIKPLNYKRNVFINILKILLFCLCSVIYLSTNYVMNQNSIKYLSEIYSHTKILYYRSSSIRFELLFCLREIYENDFSNNKLIERYKNETLKYEENIFQMNLPWNQLKTYVEVFQSVNYHDLCVSIYESQTDFNEIIECHEIQNGLLGYGLKKVINFLVNYDSVRDSKNYDHPSIINLLEYLKAGNEELIETLEIDVEKFLVDLENGEIIRIIVFLVIIFILFILIFVANLFSKIKNLDEMNRILESLLKSFGK